MLQHRLRQVTNMGYPWSSLSLNGNHEGPYCGGPLIGLAPLLMHDLGGGKNCLYAKWQLSGNGEAMPVPRTLNGYSFAGAKNI